MSVRKEIHELWLKQSMMFAGRVRLCNQVRICRNLQGYAFPVKASSVDRQEISLIIQKGLSSLMRPKKDWVVIQWNTCSEVERQILTRLFRLDFPCEETVIVFGKDRLETYIINDGDALKIQAIAPNLSLKSLWKSLDRVDAKLQNHLPYAFGAEKGYVTSVPANCGNGLDIRAWVHIPALCFKQKLLQIQEALKVMRLKMEAVELAGDKILGHQFYIANITAQGCTEEDLVNHVDTVAQDVARQEQMLRKQLWEDNDSFMKDSISRAIGVLKSCYELTFEEGMNLISVVFMGMDMGIVSENGRRALSTLWFSMPREFLSEFCGKVFDLSLESKVRADVVRACFSKYNDSLVEEVDYVS